MSPRLLFFEVIFRKYLQNFFALRFNKLEKKKARNKKKQKRKRKMKTKTKRYTGLKLEIFVGGYSPH